MDTARPQPGRSQAAARTLEHITEVLDTARTQPAPWSTSLKFRGTVTCYMHYLLANSGKMAH